MSVAWQTRGEVREHEPMAGHVSWRAGGPTRYWYKPADLDDLQQTLPQLPQPRLVVGLGSNLLVRDGGWPGCVIVLFDRLKQLEFQADGRVVVGGGLHCATLASRAARAGYAGATFFGGIPGTIGGALAMNAGAWGGETWSVVRRAAVLDPLGELHWLEREAFQVGYRELVSPIAQGLFVAAELSLEPGCDAAQEQAQLKQMLAERRAKQPVGQPSCGSVFRNPPGQYAAALIEAAGLKGERRGGAQVSTKHANFIVNREAASAADIEELLLYVQQRVREHAGVELTPEVRIVGEAA